MSVADALSRSAGRVPDRTALLFRGRPVTFAQLNAAVDRAAAGLAGLGLEPGDRVAFLVGNVPEFVLSLYGTWRAAAVGVPLNVMLTSDEVAGILADAGAKAVVVEMGYLPTVLGARDRLPELAHVLVVTGPPVPPGTRSFEEALAGVGDPPTGERADDDLALIQYTSGTTANPKGAMLTHGNLMANIEQMKAVPTTMTQDDVVLGVLPLFHIYGLNAILGSALEAGATTVLVERFDPQETLQLVERYGVTVLPGAPPMFSAWLALPDAAPTAFRSVRLALSGAAPLRAEVQEGFREGFGVPVWDSYGLTEAAPAVATTALGTELRAGSIGLPLPGLEVRLVDDQGEDVEEGDPGEIVVRGPNVFLGYWNREEDTRATILEGGWLRTGDVAVRDEDGYLFLVDRKKDLVIVSGFNVYPKEVEEVLIRHPAVQEVGVIGIPDPRTGEAVKAMVVLEPGTSATTQELADFAARSLARFKIPREIEVVPELPRLPTGKVLRRALRGEEILGGGPET
jgi:long-chain acyl-CoA synthetase